MWEKDLVFCDFSYGNSLNDLPDLVRLRVRFPQWATFEFYNFLLFMQASIVVDCGFFSIFL